MPKAFSALSERKIGEIDETIQHLTKLRAIMQKKQEMLHLSMQIKDGQIDTVRCEEEYLFITPLPPSEPLPEQKQMQMDTLLSHLQTAWDLSEYKTGCGSLLSLEKIKQHRFDEYDGLFTSLEQPCTNQWYLQKTCRALPARFLCGQLGQASRTLWPDAGLCPEKRLGASGVFL